MVNYQSVEIYEYETGTTPNIQKHISSQINVTSLTKLDLFYYEEYFSTTHRLVYSGNSVKLMLMEPLIF